MKAATDSELKLLLILYQMLQILDKKGHSYRKRTENGNFRQFGEHILLKDIYEACFIIVYVYFIFLAVPKYIS